MHVAKKEEELLASIDSKRVQMIALAERRGFRNNDTLEKSRELDVLIVEYLKNKLYA